MRAPCSLLFPLLALTACEPMDDPGSPWKPVPVASQAVVQPVAGDADGESEALPEPDPMFDVPEPVVIHSSELGKAPDEEPADVLVEHSAPGDPEPIEPVEPEPAEPAPVHPEPAPLPVALDFAQVAPVAVGAWPLRLVATVPGAQPPRAILGLPGGTEVVVTPGTMLPDAGVVVMAIGSDSIDLAEVRPAGDHAVVQGRTLQAQRSQRIEIGAVQ